MNKTAEEILNKYPEDYNNRGTLYNKIQVIAAMEEYRQQAPVIRWRNGLEFDKTNVSGAFHWRHRLYKINLKAFEIKQIMTAWHIMSDCGKFYLSEVEFLDESAAPVLPTEEEVADFTTMVLKHWTESGALSTVKKWFADRGLLSSKLKGGNQ